MLIEKKDVIVQLNGCRLTVRVVKDIEAIITDPEDEDKIPLWADIWPAARGMAKYIWDYVNFNGAETLELGAGVGLAGVAAALKDARLTVTDYNEQALALTQENLRLNGVDNAQSFLGDWRNFTLKNRYKWIIGSDVLYDPKLNYYIKDIIKTNLEPGGQLLFSHPGRKPTYDFINYLVSEGFIEKRVEIPVQIDDPFFPYYNILVHHLEQREGGV
ncbi:class I SAM-dependent methyltransferase [Desulfolucanica intricata]|uniref:class I SAM-dependent methyltransferase n=1 Tax=Desulfolucanica intricata TaxID=1285191 RepID=UPI000831A0C6|nr:methyltransferase domain-containing protein [Desulfolucanica intricata]